MLKFQTKGPWRLVVQQVGFRRTHRVICYNLRDYGVVVELRDRSKKIKVRRSPSGRLYAGFVPRHMANQQARAA